MHFRCTNVPYLDLCSCFALIVFLMYYDGKGSIALIVFFTVLWISLQCLIVVFSDHIYFFLVFLTHLESFS